MFVEIENPTGVRWVIIRADKGFYDHTLIEWLNGQRARVVIVARLTGPIKRKLAHLRYVSPSRGIEVAKFRYQPVRWPQPYRFVVVRRPQPDEPTAQLTLFKLGRITTRSWSPICPCNRSTSGASTTTVPGSNC